MFFIGFFFVTKGFLFPWVLMLCFSGFSYTLLEFFFIFYYEFRQDAKYGREIPLLHAHLNRFLVFLFVLAAFFFPCCEFDLCAIMVGFFIFDIVCLFVGSLYFSPFFLIFLDFSFALVGFFLPIALVIFTMLRVWS